MDYFHIVATLGDIFGGLHPVSFEGHQMIDRIVVSAFVVILVDFDCICSFLLLLTLTAFVVILVDFGSIWDKAGLSTRWHRHQTLHTSSQVKLITFCFFTSILVQWYSECGLWTAECCSLNWYQLYLDFYAWWIGKQYFIHTHTHPTSPLHPNNMLKKASRIESLLPGTVCKSSKEEECGIQNLRFSVHNQSIYCARVG